MGELQLEEDFLDIFQCRLLNSKNKMAERDTADYEKSEKVAIDAGKSALQKSPWLFDRAAGLRGFFVEMRKNDNVHPDHFSVHCVDGAGTKLFYGPRTGNYRFQSLDALRMNSNDMATVLNALPDSLCIYIAVQDKIKLHHMGEIMEGFRQGLEGIKVRQPFNVNMGKLETASLDEMISLGVPGLGYDIGVVLSGFIRKDLVPKLDPKPGDFIVGVASTGLHSNGHTGARHVLFTSDFEYRDEWKSQYRGRFSPNDKPDILEGKTVIEALQIPTACYFLDSHVIGDLFRSNPDIYGINITGNGLANFNRAGSGVSFEITDPLPLLPIHKLLIQESKWDPYNAYLKQNNGMGFAYIVQGRNNADDVVELINKMGRNHAQIVGNVKASDEGELVTHMHKSYEGGMLTYRGYSA